MHISHLHIFPKIIYSSYRHYTLILEKSLNVQLSSYIHNNRLSNRSTVGYLPISCLITIKLFTNPKKSPNIIYTKRFSPLPSLLLPSSVYVLLLRGFKTWLHTAYEYMNFRTNCEMGNVIWRPIDFYFSLFEDSEV